MTAAVLVAMVAGAEALRWWLRGRTLVAATGAWLLMALVAAGVSGDVGAWGAVALGAGSAGWLVLRWRAGADIAMGALVIVAGLLLLADGGPDRSAAIIAGLGIAVLLSRTANEVCRAVLDRARSLPEDDAPAPEQAPSASHLRGGRIIGPLERWLIVALALVGAEGVVVGLMAAKGIGRFPEISGDRGRGSAAEEFLVGSLVSWALAGAGALMLAVLR
ncbi:hypothetical protein [Demequina iriomotensis]|uniref:hypothetical protein n=1 Tax=Demequina iriomotensis TaxID=1536641 RepID=UPI000782B033|nr:hypothetical protein [Demequina iriomotensis]